MSTKSGMNTAVFGKWLSEQISQEATLQHFQLYYDHGLSTDTNVSAVKGFYGEKVTNHNRLADIDLLVATPEREAILMLEIEEKISPPKKLLGDVFAILMCNRIAVGRGKQQQYFSITPKTHLLIAGVIPTKGGKLSQLEQIIKPRLAEFTAPLDGMTTQNVSFLFKTNISTTIETLKKHVLPILNL